LFTLFPTRFEILIALGILKGMEKFSVEIDEGCGDHQSAIRTTAERHTLPPRCKVKPSPARVRWSFVNDGCAVALPTS
jgi:hypothetical protein